MKNSYWYRYFLVCNQMANKMVGHQPQNFALLLIEEENGRLFNKQMTSYFIAIDEFMSNLTANDTWILFDEIPMEEFAELSIEQIEADFEKYCEGRLKFKFDGDE